jgi:hypothetical protein
MKTSSIILIISFTIGIFILSALVVMYPPSSISGITVEKTDTEKFWEDYAKRYPYIIVVNSKIEPVSSWDLRSWNNTNPGIKIVGLRDQYHKDESIVFDVMIYGNGSGCGGGTVTILKVHEKNPQLFLQEYAGICKSNLQNHRVIPIHIEINTSNGQIQNTTAGKYVVLASYFQDRGSFGDVKQEFTIEDRK